MIRSLFTSQPIPLPKVRVPDLGRVFLPIVLLVAGTVTFPQIVQFGTTSGLGLWTILIGICAWMQWIARPYFPREFAPLLLPLLLFNVFVVTSLFWSGPSDPAFQNLVITLCFPGLILLTAAECERDPGLAPMLHRTLDKAALCAAVTYTIVALVYGRGGEVFLGTRPVFLARPFALFAMLCVSRQIARWLGGDRRGLYMAIWLVALAFFSDSRTATVTCLALFPLAFVCRGDRKGLAMAVVLTILGALTLTACLTFSDEFYNRFFKYDASIQVGGVSINASGRMKMWEAALEDMRGHEIFGKGIAGATRMIEEKFGSVGHPHNDFLRYLYEFGWLGLSLYSTFLLGTLGTVFFAVRRTWRSRSRDLPIHMTTLLALTSLIAAMMTDNPVVYVYVMSPVALLIGCSLGRLRAAPAGAVAGNTLGKSLAVESRWRRANSSRWHVPGFGKSRHAGAVDSANEASLLPGATNMN